MAPADESGSPPAGQIPFLGKAEERGTELECYWGNRCKIKVMAAAERHAAMQIQKNQIENPHPNTNTHTEMHVT